MERRHKDWTRIITPRRCNRIAAGLDLRERHLPWAQFQNIHLRVRGKAQAGIAVSGFVS
jgi:hypothetical protein